MGGPKQHPSSACHVGYVTLLQHAQKSWGTCITPYYSFRSQTFEDCLMPSQEFLIEVLQTCMVFLSLYSVLLLLLY